MAMALAATVVKRKAIRLTSTMATRAKSRLPSITPNQKNRNTKIMVTIEAMAINLNERSRSVRTWLAVFALPPFISFEASDTALLMMPHDLIMPMIPAMAMAPMPIDLPYSLNICSGDMSPTAVAIAGFHSLSTVSPNSRAIPGTTNHHTASEPIQMMKAYFRPTI